MTTKKRDEKRLKAIKNNNKMIERQLRLATKPLYIWPGRGACPGTRRAHTGHFVTLHLLLQLRTVSHFAEMAHRFILY